MRAADIGTGSAQFESSWQEAWQESQTESCDLEMLLRGLCALAPTAVMSRLAASRMTALTVE